MSAKINLSAKSILDPTHRRSHAITPRHSGPATDIDWLCSAPAAIREPMNPGLDPAAERRSAGCLLEPEACHRARMSSTRIEHDLDQLDLTPTKGVAVAATALP